MSLFLLLLMLNEEIFKYAIQLLLERIMYDDTEDLYYLLKHPNLCDCDQAGYKINGCLYAEVD